MIVMKIIFFANSDWYLYNFRVALARHLASKDAEVVMVSPPGDYVSALTSEGFRCISLNMNRRSTNPFTEINVIWQLVKVFRSEKPDLVHNFTIKSVVYGSIAARFASIKNIVNAVAGLGFVFSSKGLRARVLKPIVRKLLKFAMGGKNSRLILQNPDDEALFTQEKLVDSANIRLIKGSGVNTERFKLNAEKVEPAIPVVLMASRLLWDKGVLEYVETARTIKRAGQDARFILAGSPDSGNPASVTEADLRKWREEGMVDLVGHVEDMPALLKQVDIVVLPTRYGEGVPRMLIESAAAGMPLVATNVPGCREVVIHEKNGLLVEPGDTAALVAAVSKLLNDYPLRNQMGLNGRELVLREFDEKVVFEKTLLVYQELIKV